MQIMTHKVNKYDSIFMTDSTIEKLERRDSIEELVIDRL